MNKFRLLGLSGRAGSGKDYIYDHYLKPRGWHRWALADHFKIWLAAQGKWSYEDVFFNKPPEVRTDLQLEGTERGRNVFGENIWCNVTLNWFRLLNEQWGVDKFIVTDIRFVNEVKFVQDNGGDVIRVHAPERELNNRLTPEQRLHPSETALDNFTEFDHYVYNDPDQSHTVLNQINEILNDRTLIL